MLPKINMKPCFCIDKETASPMMNAVWSHYNTKSSWLSSLFLHFVTRIFCLPVNTLALMWPRMILLPHCPNIGLFCSLNIWSPWISEVPEIGKSNIENPGQNERSCLQSDFLPLRPSVRHHKSSRHPWSFQTYSRQDSGKINQRLRPDKASLHP